MSEDDDDDGLGCIRGIISAMLIMGVAALAAILAIHRM